MAKMIIVTDAWSSGATIAEEDSAAGAPASNLLTINPSEIWQTPSNAQAHVTLMRSGAAQLIDTVALLYTNASALTAQWRLRWWNSGTGQTVNSPGLDTGFIQMWPSDGLETYDRKPAIYRHGTTIAVTHVRFDIDDGANPEGAFRAGKIHVAKAFEPSRNFNKDAGYGGGYTDDSEDREVIAGTPKELVRPSYFYGQMVMDSQTPEDGHAWSELARLYGARRPVFVAFDHAGDWIQFPVDLMAYVTLGFARPPLQSTRGHQKWRVPLTMKEFA